LSGESTATTVVILGIVGRMRGGSRRSIIYRRSKDYYHHQHIVEEYGNEREKE
jgi:hypothetical protein